jgi:hypothetical protein
MQAVAARHRRATGRPGDQLREHPEHRNGQHPGHAPGRRIYFFSMATSFTAAALGAEGVGKDIEMMVGNGYARGHAEHALNLLRESPRCAACSNSVLYGELSILWQRVRECRHGHRGGDGDGQEHRQDGGAEPPAGQAAREHVAVGLSSIGRDGEERDAVFNFPKPPVLVWPGTVVATARSTCSVHGCATSSSTPPASNSPMGEIVLVKALERRRHGSGRRVAQPRPASCHRTAAPMRRRAGVPGRRAGPQPACVTGGWPTAWCWPPARRWAAAWPTCCARPVNAGLLGVPQADAATCARVCGLFDGAVWAVGRATARCSARRSPA